MKTLDFDSIDNMHNGSDFNKELRAKLRKENRMLKVLWITDDRVAEDFEDYNEMESEQWFVSVDIINVFKYKAGYDVVMIDYGMLGDEYKNSQEEMRRIKVLQEYYATDIKMVWCGGLGGNKHYQNAVIIDFPRQKFLHNLKSLPLNDYYVNFNRWLGGVDKW